MKNLGTNGKWAALEKDGSTQHRCEKNTIQPDTTNTTTSTTTEITSPQPKTVSNSNGHIDVDHTNAEKIIALEKRLASIESWISGIQKLSQSYEVNHL